MRVTQGCFSFLPDLTDEQISRQVQYCLEKGWAVNIEFTDDPHPRNNFWEMWGLPMFDLRDAAGVMMELAECRKVIWRPLYPHVCVRFQPRLGSRCGCPSSSTGRRTSPASGSNGMKVPGATFATPRNPMPPIVPRAGATVK